MKKTLYQRALDYHRSNPPGKLKVVATKPLSTQEDLALAYSPGVAAVSEAIQTTPKKPLFSQLVLILLLLFRMERLS